jgi:hypothetical protein
MKEILNPRSGTVTAGLSKNDKNPIAKSKIEYLSGEEKKRCAAVHSIKCCFVQNYRGFF